MSRVENLLVLLKRIESNKLKVSAKRTTTNKETKLSTSEEQVSEDELNREMQDIQKYIPD